MMNLFQILLNKLHIFNTLLLFSMDRVNQIISKLARLPTWNDGISKSVEGKKWIKETTAKVLRQRGGETKFHNPKFVGEFRQYVNVVCWMIGNKDIRADLNLFLRRVEKVILSSSSTWAFAYLKEAYRITVCALSGRPEAMPYGSNSLLVRRDKHGLPTILPIRLRLVLIEFINSVKCQDVNGHGIEDSILAIYPTVLGPKMDPRLRKDVVGILTVMTIFRTFKTKVTPTISTIIAPFGGTTRTFSMSTISVALQRLGLVSGIGFNTPKLSVGRFIPHRSTKTGPNGSISVLSASLDALALLHEPRVLGSLII